MNRIQTIAPRPITIVDSTMIQSKLNTKYTSIRPNVTMPVHSSHSYIWRYTAWRWSCRVRTL